MSACPSLCAMASPAVETIACRWAASVNAQTSALIATKGTFSRTSSQVVDRKLEIVNRPSGQKSSNNSTPGSVTAIGLLIKASANKTSATAYQTLDFGLWTLDSAA